MSVLSPLDSGLTELLSGFDQRLRALETARQPYQGDWVELDAGAFSATGYDTKITVDQNTYTLDTLFGIGDIIRYKISGVPSYYYKYVVYTEDETIYTDGMTIGSFTDFAYSKVLSPTGFVAPVLGTYPMIFTAPPSGITDNGSEFSYTMCGRIITINLTLDITLTGTPSTVEFETPIASDYIADGFRFFDGGGQRIWIGGTQYVVTWNSITDRFIITPVTGNWTATNHASTVTFFIYVYPT